MEKIFRALSDKTRLELMLIIDQIPNICLCDLEKAFSLSNSNLSRHLKELYDVDLLDVVKQGKWKYYTVSSLGIKYIQFIHSQCTENDLQKIINLSLSIKRSLQC